MYVINGKRVIFIFITLIISFLSFLNFNKNNEITPTSSLPISDKLIILDAGHRIS